MRKGKELSVLRHKRKQLFVPNSNCNQTSQVSRITHTVKKLKGLAKQS